MFVVPVAGDKVKMIDGDVTTVTSFTSLKKEPSVYVDNPDVKVLAFSQIEEINGVRVEYNQGSKCFESMGQIRRKINLPQPGDSVQVTVTTMGEKTTDTLKVKYLKLHNRTEGISKGLLVCDDMMCVTLADIENIERKTGSEPFNVDKFKKYYFDYLPFKGKSKG